MQKNNLYILICILCLSSITISPLTSFAKTKKYKSLSQIVLDQNVSSFSCEDLKKSDFDSFKRNETLLFSSGLDKACSVYKTDTDKEACLNFSYFNSFANSIQTLMMSVYRFEHGGKLEETVNNIYKFFAVTRDSLPKNINFGNEIDKTINTLLSGEYPDSMKTSFDKEDKSNLFPMKYRTFIDVSMDLKKFLKEHESFLSDIKNFNETIPYYKDLCEKSIQKKEQTTTNVDNVSTCFLKVQSFTQAIKVERKIDFKKSKPKGKELVHGMNGQTNDKDCGIVNGIWSADSDANIIRSSLTIQLPNGEPRKFDVNVLKSYLQKIDKEIQNSPTSNIVDKKKACLKN